MEGGKFGDDREAASSTVRWEGSLRGDWEMRVGGRTSRYHRCRYQMQLDLRLIMPRLVMLRGQGRSGNLVVARLVCWC